MYYMHALTMLLVAVVACAVVWRQRFETYTAAVAVVGGQPANSSRYPYYCLILGPGACGGVLVGPTTVLTAKHCGGQAMVGASVFIGGVTPAGQPSQGEDRRTVTAVKQVAGFDIMILTLDKPSTKRPISLATRLPPPSTPVTILGRGAKTGRTDAPFDPAFTKATVTYTDNTTALRAIMAETVVADAQKRVLSSMLRSPAYVVATSRTKSGCYGDSGGPLIIERSPGQDELLGIVSFGPDGAHGQSCEMSGTTTFYSVFASIPYFTQNRARIDALTTAVSARKCTFAGRANSKCPASHPWDTGVAADAASISGIDFPIAQCTTTRQCAQTLNAFYGMFNQTSGPARYAFQSGGSLVANWPRFGS